MGELKLSASVVKFVINQYSFVLIGLVTVISLAFISWRFMSVSYVLPVVGVALGLLILSHWFLSADGDRYSTVQEFDAAIMSGNPVMLMLYSNF